MFVTRGKLLAFDFVKLDSDFDQDRLLARIRHSFSAHSGFIAFYGFLNYSNIGHQRLEHLFNQRLELHFADENCDLRQTVAGPRLFGFDLPLQLGFDKQAKIKALSALGVNCLKCLGTATPSIWGSSIMTAPGEFFKSKYNFRADDAWTLGDFLLLR